MKKLFIVLFTIFCAVLIAVSIYTFVPTQPQPTQELQQVEYTIKDYGGKVAVFENNSREPLVVYEIYTHLLPENDITVYTNEQHGHHTVGVDVDWEFSENTLQGIYLPVLTPASHGTEDIHAIIDDFILKRERYSASNAKFAAKFLDILCKIDK